MKELIKNNFMHLVDVKRTTQNTKCPLPIYDATDHRSVDFFRINSNGHKLLPLNGTVEQQLFSIYCSVFCIRLLNIYFTALTHQTEL